MPERKTRELTRADLEKRIVRAEFATEWSPKTGYYFTNPRLYLEDGNVITFEAKSHKGMDVKILLEGP
jgi:hypothetical protein